MRHPPLSITRAPAFAVPEQHQSVPGNHTIPGTRTSQQGFVIIRIIVATHGHELSTLWCIRITMHNDHLFL
jgi:hypothetical protein